MQTEPIIKITNEKKDKALLIETKLVHQFSKFVLIVFANGYFLPFQVLP